MSCDIVFIYRSSSIFLWPSSLDPFMWCVATYPSAGGRRETRGMRVPRKEYARSRHQRLFEENVGKTGKDAIYELLSERFESCIYARGRVFPFAPTYSSICDEEIRPT
ncbi:hypothetical protein GmHk_14G041033 [Glycine max]|nr:hypothetical protein GmHk_14G041033 [Glycine max]